MIRKTMFAFFLFMAVFYLSGSRSFAEDWDQINPANSPDARFGHSMVTLPNGKTVLYGGETNGDVNDQLFIHEANGWGEIEVSGEKPSARFGQDIVVMPDGTIILFGGEGEEASLSNELYAFEANDWEKIEPANTPPSARKDYVAWTDGDKYYVGGGEGENGNTYKDLWAYDPETKTWEQKADAPYSFKKAGIMASGKYAYVNGTDDRGILLKYDIANNTWSRFTPGGTLPSNLYRRSMMATHVNEPIPFLAPDSKVSRATSSSGKAWMIGGSGYNSETLSWETLKDTWMFDFETETWTQGPDLPIALQAGAAAYSPLSNQIVLFGGKKDDETLSGNTYILTAAYPTLPGPDIKANNTSGTVTIGTNDTLTITISLDDGGNTTTSDWWLVYNDSSGNWNYYDLSSGTWVSGLAATYQGALFDLSSYSIDVNGLTSGTNTFYFGVDSNKNGSVDSSLGKIYYDTVTVIVQ